MLALLLTGDTASRFDNLLERFDKEWVPSRGYADRTLREIQFKLARYREDMGGLLVQILPSRWPKICASAIRQS